MSSTTLRIRPMTPQQHTAALQHAAKHCNTPQHCSSLQRTVFRVAVPRGCAGALHQQFNRLGHLPHESTAAHRNTATHGVALECAVFLVLWCLQLSVVQHTATQCNTVQHSATQCNTLMHTATHCRNSRDSGRFEEGTAERGLCGCAGVR